MTPSPARRGGRGRIRLVLLVGWVWCLLAVGTALAPVAHAHANLVSTDPDEGAVLAEAPSSLTLTFDEPVDLSAESVRLYDATGTAVAEDARSVDDQVVVTPDERLGRGTYVLTFRVVSADGHPIAGSLSFSVGSPSDTVVAPPDPRLDSDPAVTAVQGVVQGVTYLALMLAGGLVVFLAFLLPDSPALSGARRRLLRVVKAAAGVAVAGAMLLVPIGAVYQQGLGIEGLGTRLAWVNFHEQDGLFFFLVLAGCGVTAGVLNAERPDKVDRITLSVSMALAVGSVAMVGHTRSYGPTALVVVADLLHVLAAAVWFGGLVGLAFTLPVLGNRERLAASTLARFSTLAGAVLVVVAAAGLVLGWRILGSWSGLVGTRYGLVLLAKVAIVALVALVAGWNRYRLLPAVAGDAAHQQRARAASRLRSAVRLEAVGLVAVLLLTGFLVNQVPEEGDTALRRTAEDSTVTATADDVRVVAHLDPGAVGANTLTVQVQDLSGEPLEPYATPVVSVGSGEVDLGSRPVRNVDSGTYRSRVVLPRAGEWDVRVSVRTDEFTNPVLTLELDVRG